MTDRNPYEDIINLPHHVSERHAQMSAIDRAAQFSPFAALTGHGAAINETARITTKKTELSDEEKAILDMKCRLLAEMSESRPLITVTYFVYDRYKDGGEYVKVSGRLRTINECRKRLYLTDGTEIETGDILEIESDLFLGMVNE